MKYFLAVVILLSCHILTAQDLPLFSKDGKAIAYIDTTDKDQTIYLYSGKPVAFVEGTNVYGFNGIHLGWFEHGIIYDHNGRRTCQTKAAATTYTGYEPYKNYKQRKPYIPYKKYPPYKPYFSNSWSGTSFEALLLQGAKE